MKHQKDIRMESIQGICDAISRGCTEGSEMGKMTVLPASHTGGAIDPSVCAIDN